MHMRIPYQNLIKRGGVIVEDDAMRQDQYTQVNIISQSQAK